LEQGLQMMNAALWNGSRTKTPRESMNHCFFRALDIFHTFREDVKQQKAARQELISEAVVMKLLNGQNRQTAMAIFNQGYGEYAVSPSTLPSQSHIVHVEGATCSCSYYYQKQFPCTHIAAVLPQHVKLVGVRHSLLDFCHDAYTTNTIYDALQSRYNTGCPKVPDATKVNARATYLRPAHWYYGQGKASDLHPVNPGRMLKRRFRSNGEHLGAKCHKRSNAVTHNHSSVVLQ
jgi:SWIM zinc finger